MNRTLVAVGSSRLACMFLAIRSAPNRRRSAPSGTRLSRTGAAAAVSGGSRAGVKSSKNSFQSGPTLSLSSRYRRYISSISHMFGPSADVSISCRGVISRARCTSGFLYPITVRRRP